MQFMPVAVLEETCVTHFAHDRAGSWVTMIHFASAVCLQLVWLWVRNVHRRITHLPSPVADNYRLVTACFTFLMSALLPTFSPLSPSRVFALLPSALPLLALWAAIPYEPWTLLLLPWPGHLQRRYVPTYCAHTHVSWILALSYLAVTAKCPLIHVPTRPPMHKLVTTVLQLSRLSSPHASAPSTPPPPPGGGLKLRLIL